MITPQRKSDWEHLQVANTRLLESATYYYRKGSIFVVLKNHGQITVRSSYGHVITTEQDNFTILDTPENRRQLARNGARTLRPKYRRARKGRSTIGKTYEQIRKK